jgi:rhodanese-related sulfurtransferase
MKTLQSRILGFTCSMLLLAMAGTAAAVETPSTLAGATIVDSSKVQEMMRAGVTVYDTRVAAEYAEAHIKGAKSLPYKEKSAKAASFDKGQDDFALEKLPSDKNTPVIFYCNAGDCWKSYKASKVAIDAGYKKVHWYRGGIPDWRAKGLPVE